MSAPSTPRSSGGGSPISWTPEESAARNEGEQLTPRSKYKQLLADFDDSDEDVVVRKSKTAKQSIPSAAKAIDDKNEHSQTGELDSESDTSIQRPQGRMAARMMGRTDTTEQSKAPIESEKEAEQLSPPSSNAWDQQEEEEEELPISKPTRRLKHRTSSPDSTLARHSSPGLFVSPAKSLPQDRSSGTESESDGFGEIGNTKFKELLAKKKAEKRALKKAAKQKKAQRSESRVNSDAIEDFIVNDPDENADDEEAADQQLTQHSKPTRKASKKALEEINRETQRLARNQYLAHQATVKRKVTKHDLFKRFNFKTDSTEQVTARKKTPEHHSEDEFIMSGALVSSDAEGDGRDTPATSPPSGTEREQKSKDMVTETESRELEPLEELLTKGAKSGEQRTPSKAPVVAVPEITVVSTAVEVSSQAPSPKAKPRKRVRVVLPKITRRVDEEDSDDDLVIEKPTAVEVLQNAPSRKERESNSMLNLRHLANLNSPGKKRKAKGEASMTSSELFAQLRLKARIQALQEKEERINDLKAKGIHIETEEERERAQLDMENLLEKAREEAQMLAKKEKEAAKKEGKEGEGNLFDDESDDEEFVEEADEEPEEDEELSLSEDDDEDDDDEEVEATNPLFDQEAEDEGSDRESEGKVADAGELESLKPTASASVVEQTSPAFKKPALQPRHRKVVVDDDDEEDVATQPEHNVLDSTHDKIAAAFGFGTSNDSGPGLSQFFGATMQSQQSESMNANEDSMEFFQNLSNSVPHFTDGEFFPESNLDKDADKVTQMPRVHLGISQFPSQSLMRSPSVMSEVPEPTQDVGFRIITPAKFPVPTSTLETEPMQTPVPKRRRQLRRKASLVAVLSDDEDGPQQAEFDDDEEFIVSKDAFSALFKGAKKKGDTETFDKKKSAAKDMIQEQAEESEDEYAGLGGASDDESMGELDEETKKMIDEGPVNVNEQQLAAFHADKERQSDEKQINKLYKDITTGMLRRKRGGDFDELDDSDDDMAERRRRKQEEFARMRRALLADENVSRLAQNPKQEAFFHAIEDLDDFARADFLDDMGDEDEGVAPDTQVEDADEDKENRPVEAESQAQPAIGGKRKLIDAFAGDDEKYNARPSKRTQAPATGRSKIFNPVELRKSLSFICDETVMVPATQTYSSDHEEDDTDEGEDVAIAGSLTISRTNTSESLESMASSRSASLNIVNRLIRRQSSLEMNSNSNQPVAFVAAGAQHSFKAPSLLRRATGLSTVSNSSTGSKSGSSKENVVPTSNGSNGSTRFGGSKKSNMHYQAKEAERRKLVEAVEAKKKKELKSLTGKGKSILGTWGSRAANGGFE